MGRMGCTAPASALRSGVYLCCRSGRLLHRLGAPRRPCTACRPPAPRSVSRLEPVIKPLEFRQVCDDVRGSPAVNHQPLTSTLAAPSLTRKKYSSRSWSSVSPWTLRASSRLPRCFHLQVASRCVLLLQ